jgi:hypothetical protein
VGCSLKHSGRAPGPLGLGKDGQKALTTYNRKIQKLTRDSAFRKKLTRQFSVDHSAFE